MYNKLFTKILDSSIWMESTPTRIVWITLLAAMDQDGFVALASLQNVAHRARVTLNEAKAAIEVLQSPDAVSPDQEHQGRRIERVPSGWMVLNAAKYRDTASRVESLRLNRERVRRHREKRRCNATCNATVMQSEADTEADTDTKKNPVPHARHFEIPALGEVAAYCQERGNSVDPQQWFDFYTSKGWMIGKNRMKDWRAAVRTWEKNNSHPKGNSKFADLDKLYADEK